MRQVVVYWTGGTPGYGDARVDGRYAISNPGVEIVTDTGPVPQFENRAAHYLRVANQGERFAAGYTSAQPDRAREWTGSVTKWQDRGPICGVNPVIYNASNALVVVAACAPPTGSQGWRYLNDATGQLVTADSTMADTAKGIFEFTKWPDIWIGQGHTGVKVWTPDLGTRPFSFEAVPVVGNLRFIRARRVGDDFALTVVDLGQAPGKPAGTHQTTVTWATLADLRGQIGPTPDPPCGQCGRTKAAHLRVPLVTGGETWVCPRNVYQ